MKNLLTIESKGMVMIETSYIIWLRLKYFNDTYMNERKSHSDFSLVGCHQ